MKPIDVPVGERFVATIINKEGEEDCIAVECVPSDFDRECSKCALHLKGCGPYCCVATTRKDRTSVYFKEIAADIKSWAIREKAVRGCKDGFIKTRPDVETDGAGAVEDNGIVVLDIYEPVGEICECASKLLKLSEFQKEVKPEQEYCFKICKKSGGVLTEVPFDFNGCLSDKIFEQLPCLIDKRIKDLKHLINKL